MKNLFFVVLLSNILIPLAAVAAGNDELWEVQTAMDVGITVLPAVTHTVCLGKGGAYKPEQFLQQNNCEMTDLVVSGNKTNWKVHCTGANALEGQGEVIRTADTMSGTVYMSAGGMQTNQIISGKRIGTCQQE